MFAFYCYNIIYSFDEAEFLASLLQSSASHDPSEIILICCFAAQETFVINICVETMIKKFLKNP